MFTCGLERSNLAFATLCPPGLLGGYDSRSHINFCCQPVASPSVSGRPLASFLLLAEYQIIRVTNIFAPTLCFEASRATRELGNGQHTASYVTLAI